MSRVSRRPGVPPPGLSTLLLGVALLTGGRVLAGCTSNGSGDAGAITITDPVVGAVPGDSAALYMTIDNDGSDDALVGASCACASKASLHRTRNDNGIEIMESADEVDLPSGQSVVFAPGGVHIMLEDLQAPLEAGAKVEVELDFDNAAPRSVEVPVVPLDELAKRVDQS